MMHCYQCLSKRPPALNTFVTSFLPPSKQLCKSSLAIIFTRCDQKHPEGCCEGHPTEDRFIKTLLGVLIHFTVQIWGNAISGSSRKLKGSWEIRAWIHSEHPGSRHGTTEDTAEHSQSCSRKDGRNGGINVQERRGSVLREIMTMYLFLQ